MGRVCTTCLSVSIGIYSLIVNLSKLWGVDAEHEQYANSSWTALSLNAKAKDLTLISDCLYFEMFFRTERGDKFSQISIEVDHIFGRYLLL